MATMLAVLHDHGVDVDEAELAAAVEAGLGWVLTTPGSVTLPPGEGDLLDASGLPDKPGAYAEAAATAAGAYAALVATSLTAGEAAVRLGVTEGRVRHKIGRGDLYSLPS